MGWKASILIRRPTWVTVIARPKLQTEQVRTGKQLSHSNSKQLYHSLASTLLSGRKFMFLGRPMKSHETCIRVATLISSGSKSVLLAGHRRLRSGSLVVVALCSSCRPIATPLCCECRSRAPLRHSIDLFTYGIDHDWELVEQYTTWPLHQDTVTVGAVPPQVNQCPTFPCLQLTSWVHQDHEDILDGCSKQPSSSVEDSQMSMIEPSSISRCSPLFGAVPKALHAFASLQANPDAHHCGGDLQCTVA